MIMPAIRQNQRSLKLATKGAKPLGWVGIGVKVLNWLQVSASTKLSEIDEREGKEFEPQMTTLFGLKAQQ